MKRLVEEPETARKMGAAARLRYEALFTRERMAAAYAELYEPLGFILSTILFGTALCAMLGAGVARSIVFGVGTGVAGYLLCAVLLDLNLPEGALIEALLEPSTQEEGAS